MGGKAKSLTPDQDFSPYTFSTVLEASFCDMLRASKFSPLFSKMFLKQMKDFKWRVFCEASL
jgi:hypothetical protein